MVGSGGDGGSEAALLPGPTTATTLPASTATTAARGPRRSRRRDDEGHADPGVRRRRRHEGRHDALAADRLRAALAPCSSPTASPAGCTSCCPCGPTTRRLGPRHRRDPREHAVLDQVDLAAHELTVLDGDQVVLQSQTVIGTPATPTPKGTFYVTDPVDLRSHPNGSYGAFALGLSGYSEVLMASTAGPVRSRSTARRPRTCWARTSRTAACASRMT